MLYFFQIKYLDFFLLESPKWSGPRGPQGPEFGPLHFKGPKGPGGPRVTFSLFVIPKAPRGCSINCPIFDARSEGAPVRKKSKKKVEKNRAVVLSKEGVGRGSFKFS